MIASFAHSALILKTLQLCQQEADQLEPFKKLLRSLNLWKSNQKSRLSSLLLMSITLTSFLGSNSMMTSTFQKAINKETYLWIKFKPSLESVLPKTSSLLFQPPRMSPPPSPIQNPSTLSSVFSFLFRKNQTNQELHLCSRLRSILLSP